MHLPGVVDGEVDVERRAVDGDSLDGSIASQRRVLNRYTLRRNAIQQAGAYSQPSSSSAARRLTGAMFAGTGARWACSPLAAASALVSRPTQGSTAVNSVLKISANKVAVDTFGERVLVAGQVLDHPGEPGDVPDGGVQLGAAGADRVQPPSIVRLEVGPGGR